jgi:hypothetical protein
LASKRIGKYYNSLNVSNYIKKCILNTWNLSHSVCKECREKIISVVGVQIWNSFVNDGFVRLWE